MDVERIVQALPRKAGLATYLCERNNPELQVVDVEG